MALSMLLVGSVGLFVGGVAAWYTVCRLRVASRLERVPVQAGRTQHVRRQGVDPGRGPE